MDALEFIELLENPEKVGRKSVEELKSLSQAFPYSQPVQLLYAMRLSQSSEYLFNRQLGKTSILTDDRSVLFDRFEREADERASAEIEPKPSDEDILEKDLEREVKKSAQAEVSTGSTSETSSAPDSTDSASASGRSAAASTDSVEEEKQEIPPPTSDKEEKTEGIAKEVEEEIQQEKEAPIERDKEKPVAGESAPPLSPKERIKAILEENRKLREQHGKKKSEASEFDQRVAGIRERLEKLKRNKDGEDPQNQVSGDPSETKPEMQKPATEKVEKTPEEETPEAEKEDLTSQAAPPEAGEPASQTESIQEEALLEQHRQDTEPVLVDEGTEEEAGEEEPEAVFVIGDEQEADESASSEREKKPEDDEAGRSPGRYQEKERSFSEWLKKLHSDEDSSDKRAFVAGTEKSSGGEPRDFETKIQLLDSFVEKLPELKKKRNIAPKPETNEIETGRLSEEETSLVTETLARVYVKQKHYDKAMKAYEILRLKYPEKSSFFADRISGIKKLINSK